MDSRREGFGIQSTPDNSNLQGKLKMVRVIRSSSYRELRTNDRKYVKNIVHCIGFIQCTFKFNCIKVEWKWNNTLLPRLLYKSECNVT